MAALELRDGATAAEIRAFFGQLSGDNSPVFLRFEPDGLCLVPWENFRQGDLSAFSAYEILRIVLADAALAGRILAGRGADPETQRALEVLRGIRSIRIGAPR